MTTCADFGVCDVSELLHAFPDAIADMARSIRHTIQTYEPRLANVRIRHIPAEDMTLRFEITAQLTGQTGKSAVSFETSVDAARRVSVR
jgi:type VI secretion system protein